MSILHKIIFSAAPAKFFFIHGSNNSDSVVFSNEGFGEIKDHSSTMTLFQIKFLLWKFEICIVLHEKTFSGAPVNHFFLYGSNNPEHYSFWKCSFWRDQRLKFENNTFSIKRFAMKVLHMYLLYVKRCTS